jgi:intraflagellar transport protein 172
MQKECNLFLI